MLYDDGSLLPSAEAEVDGSKIPAVGAVKC
jgi:hypothetical protein